MYVGPGGCLVHLPGNLRPARELDLTLPAASPGAFFYLHTDPHRCVIYGQEAHERPLPQAVDVHAVLSAIQTWIVPLFESSTSVVGISTSPSMRDQTLKTFTELGYVLDVKKL